MLTVIVPVGPKPSHKRWLTECLESIRAQTTPPEEILIIDDGANLTQEEVGMDARIWRMPCVAGAVHAINFGVALAKYDLVLILASDDILRPWCVADCLREYQLRNDPLGYYWMDVEYSDGRIQKVPSGMAMVTKQLWQHTGGYAIESTVGAPDWMFLCAIDASKGKGGKLWQVKSHAPPYWFRLHGEQMQATQNMKYSSVLGLVRDIITKDWLAKWQ